MLEKLTPALEAYLASNHADWVEGLRKSINKADSLEDILHSLARWHGKLRAGYGRDLGDAMALAWLIGRASVLDELDDDERADVNLADPTIGTVTFKEAQEFLRQKVSLPSKEWTQTLHQFHDRGFVVAGADSVALVEDLRGALDRAINKGGGLGAFRKGFDDIITRTGWDYNGGRNWRTRVIYDTNLRTAHMAGRLKQMRDPDVVKLRPYWQYVHAQTRTPKIARDEHLAWDGKVFRHDDPIWSYLYPPNGWKCSCGVITLNDRGLKRLGKDKPDTPPKLKFRKVADPTTGDKISVPEGIDFGWGYQPGNTWEQGLVPKGLQKPLPLSNQLKPDPNLPPLTDLGRAFASPELPRGRDPEFYVSKFLQRFGASIGRGAMFRDKAGQAIIISDALFRTGDGRWKVMKGSRNKHIERLAEAIFDPDEIWVDWQEVNGVNRLVRRYLRWDKDSPSYSAFSWSSKAWWGATSFVSVKVSNSGLEKPRPRYLEQSRKGALLYRRNEKK